MPRPPVLAQVERRLAQLGCPGKLARRKLRELAEHHEDLKQDALEEGLGEAEADARADALLGEPMLLADYVATALQLSSWRGRHPVITFCLLPPLAIVLILALGLGIDSFILTHYFTTEQFSVLAGEGSGLALFRAILTGTYFAAIALAALLFCGLARRTLTGMKWAWIACGMCALHGIFFYAAVQPHNFTVGYGTAFNWGAIAIPLCVGLVAWAKRHHAARQLASLSALSNDWPAGQINYPTSPLPKFPRPRLITPTSILATLAVAGIVSLIFWARMQMAENSARTASLHALIWPRERAAARAQVASRQLTRDTVNETTIDLRSCVNAALADSLDGTPGMAGNNLAELPMGTHIDGGVPFNVQGRIQLFGRSLADAKTRFPSRIRDLAIARKCAWIYLLHGAAMGSEPRGPMAVAHLVLHYADGSQSEIAIKAGEHLLNWQGPVYSTGAHDKFANAALGTELAWIGSNAWLEKRRPEDSLRLYRSAFANPHPELEITTVDYVSDLTDAAPFIVGITVE